MLVSSSIFGSSMSSSFVCESVTPSPAVAISSLEDDLFGNFGFELIDSAADRSATPSLRQRTTRGPRERYYAIFRVPAESKLVVGVWRCEWNTLRKGLKNGSGVNLKASTLRATPSLIAKGS